MSSLSRLRKSLLQSFKAENSRSTETCETGMAANSRATSCRDFGYSCSIISGSVCVFLNLFNSSCRFWRSLMSSLMVFLSCSAGELLTVIDGSGMMSLSSSLESENRTVLALLIRCVILAPLTTDLSALSALLNSLISSSLSEQEMSSF